MRATVRAAMWMCFALTLSSCWPGPEVGPEQLVVDEEGLPDDDGISGEPGPDGGSAAAPPGQMGFAELQAKIFTPSCGTSFCHQGNPPASAPMTLEPAAAYAALVGKAASQASGLKRVEPGNPSKSYLLLKLKGQAGSVGGTATRMPLNKPALSAAQVAEIEAWIQRGAPND